VTYAKHPPSLQRARGKTFCSHRFGCKSFRVASANETERDRAETDPRRDYRQVIDFGKV